jgi:hypothetical protein
MAGIEQLGISLRIAMVVVPVALYFLILGLLNSRPCPQLLRGRRDFVLLLVALCPLFVLPLLSWVQDSWLLLAVALAGGAAGLTLVAPPAASWVVYNISPAEAAQAVAQALGDANLPFSRDGSRFELTGRSGSAVSLNPFPLLRNVSVRLIGADDATAGLFEARLAGRLQRIPTETTPTTMALLLVAAGMLVAPLALVAPQAGEIVRILTGMLY